MSESTIQCRDCRYWGHMRRVGSDVLGRCRYFNGFLAARWLPRGTEPLTLDDETCRDAIPRNHYDDPVPSLSLQNLVTPYDP